MPRTATLAFLLLPAPAFAAGTRFKTSVHLAALQAGMVAAMKAKGVQLDAAQIGEAMNPANVEFLETHRKEMDDLGRAQQDLQKVSEKANRGQREPSQGEEK